MTFTKVFWYVMNNGTLLDGRRHRSLMPSVHKLAQLISSRLPLTVVTDYTPTDSHVNRSECFQLVFRGDVRQYAEVGRILWRVVRRRLANLSDDGGDLNASVVIAYNEEYVIPSEYV